MRFLIVHKDYVQDVRNLIAALGVDDVQLLICGGERRPEGDTARHLQAISGTEVAFLGVHRKYQKTVRQDYVIEAAVSIASFRGGRATLEAWLRPVTAPPPTWTTPREAFRRAAESQPGLVLAEGALDHADRIEARRVPFANRAAGALAEYAAASATAPAGLAQFFAERGVSFAHGGDITATYTIHRTGVDEVARSTQWHLKEGDRTSAEDAARVYFHAFENLVIVLRCGPHPAGDFQADVRLP